MDNTSLGRVALGFRALAVLSVVCLWGIMTWNGGVWAMVLAAWHGQLGDEVLVTRYTGFPLVDFPLALLVAFFFHVTSGRDADCQLLVLDGYATLQSAFVWLFVEKLRAGNKPWAIERPLLFAFLWQFAGAAIALPLYFAYHLLWAGGSTSAVYRVSNVHGARALPFSFLLGAVLPALIGEAPTWNGPDFRTPRTHQLILAVWQADPVWVALIQLGLSSLSARFSGTVGHVHADAHTPDHVRAHAPHARTNGRAHGNAHAWVRASYLVAAGSSALGHLYAMGRIATGSSGVVDWLATLARVYVPSALLTGPRAAPELVSRGAWLYLQYDVAIFSLACLLWAFFLVVSVGGVGTAVIEKTTAVVPKWSMGREFVWNKLSAARVERGDAEEGDRVVGYSKIALAGLVAAGSLTIGPGATVSLALYVREGLLAEE